MKTDSLSGYPMRKILYAPWQTLQKILYAEDTLFTLANPWTSLRFNAHWSAPPVSALARSGGPVKMSQSPVSRNSNIERRMDRHKSVVKVIRGVE